MSDTTGPEVQRTKRGIITSPGCIFYYLREERTEWVDDEVDEQGEVVEPGYCRSVMVPYACVAIRDASPSEDVRAVCRGIAVCSPNENFSKAKGRALAYKRLRIMEGIRQEGAPTIGLKDPNHRFQDRRLPRTASLRYKYGYGSPTKHEENLMGTEAVEAQDS